MRSIIKKWKAGVIALSTGALVVSCNSDFLDRPTLGTMDETTFLKTEEAGYKLLTSCYLYGHSSKCGSIWATKSPMTAQKVGQMLPTV